MEERFDELMLLVEGNRLKELRHELTQMNVVDIAAFFEELDNKKALVLFRILPKELSSEVFAYMDQEQREHIVVGISDSEINHLISELFLDDTIDFLEEVPANVVKRVLKNTSEDKRKLINNFLQYPDNTAGSLMTIEFMELRKDMTSEQALNLIRVSGTDKETLDTCYIVDPKKKLIGTIGLRKLILSDSGAVLEDIMNTNLITVNAHDDQEEVADTFRKYDLLSMPVVDNELRLVGIITIDDIVDVIEQENTEDFERMAAITPSEDEYLRTPVTRLALNRIPWLLILMISATLTQMVISSYDMLLSQVTVLAAFIPMLMNTSGNCGSQTSTLVIRGMALGEIEMSDFFKVLFKEMRVALIVGVCLAAVNFARMYIFNNSVGLPVMLAVSATLICAATAAKMVGAMLPIAAKRLGLDPAMMAGPFITTCVDAISVSFYFAFATLLLGFAA